MTIADQLVATGGAGSPISRPCRWQRRPDRLRRRTYSNLSPVNQANVAHLYAVKHNRLSISTTCKETGPRKRPGQRGCP